MKQPHSMPLFLLAIATLFTQTGYGASHTLVGPVNKVTKESTVTFVRIRIILNNLYKRPHNMCSTQVTFDKKHQAYTGQRGYFIFNHDFTTMSPSFDEAEQSTRHLLASTLSPQEAEYIFTALQKKYLEQEAAKTKKKKKESLGN